MESDMDDARLGDPLHQFWAMAQAHVGIGTLRGVIPTPWNDAILPPAFSFGDSPELADELLALVLDGKKTATTGLEQEYLDEGEPIPKVGDLSIVTDGNGTPRALIRDEEVCVLAFGDVTAKQAALEGEDDRTLESWRRVHRAIWHRRGVEITDDTRVVWERFSVKFQVQKLRLWDEQMDRVAQISAADVEAELLADG